MLVPTLEIDLAWHTHQMLPVRYREECMMLVGRFVNHDDNVDDTKLEANLARTARLWKKAHNETYLTYSRGDNDNERNCAGAKAIGAGWVLLMIICVCTTLSTLQDTHGIRSPHRRLQAGNGSSDESESSARAESWIVAMLALCAGTTICGVCLVNWGCCDWKPLSVYRATKNARTEVAVANCGACGECGCVAAPTPAVFDSHSDTKGIGFLQSTEAAEAVSAEQASELLRTLGGNVGAGHRSCPKAELLDETTRHALIRHIDERSRNDKNKNCGHDLRLEPTRADLEALIGAPTVASLITFFGAKPDAFRLRRVEADANKTDAAVAFHTDFSRRTMQVPLNDEGDYDGGRLVFVTDQGLEMPSRPAGSATIHTSGVVHGVTALRRGVRYSLYLCQLPDGGVDINKRHLDGCGLSYLADPVALQFDFFARAVPFLETATDAELGRVVAAYAAFLRVAVSTTDALKAPSLGVEIVWRVRFHSTFRFLFTHSLLTFFLLSAHVLLDVCGRRTC